MKLRSVVVVMSAALVGVTTPGFAQAGKGDGHRRGASQYSQGDHRHHGHHRSDRGSNSNGLAIALGIGLLGLAIASQYDDQPQPYAYAPAYPAPGYGYAPGYSQAPRYGYAPGYDGSRYANRGYSRYGHVVEPINPMTGY